MLCRAGFPISELSRRYKEKIKKLLEGGNHIDINIDIVKIVMNNVLDFYLKR